MDKGALTSALREWETALGNRSRAERFAVPARREYGYLPYSSAGTSHPAAGIGKIYSTAFASPTAFTFPSIQSAQGRTGVTVRVCPSVRAY